MDDRGFCDLCHHRVNSMGRHLQSKDHLYQSKRTKDFTAKPRLPGQPIGMEDNLPFPGRIRLGGKEVL